MMVPIGAPTGGAKRKPEADVENKLETETIQKIIDMINEIDNQTSSPKLLQRCVFKGVADWGAQMTI
jgi:hypothetical protein